MDDFIQTAIAVAEAKQGLQEGGISISSVLVKDGEIIGRGHNKHVQDSVVKSSLSDKKLNS